MTFFLLSYTLLCTLSLSLSHTLTLFCALSYSHLCRVTVLCTTSHTFTNSLAHCYANSNVSTSHTLLLAIALATALSHTLAVSQRTHNRTRCAFFTVLHTLSLTHLMQNHNLPFDFQHVYVSNYLYTFAHTQMSHSIAGSCTLSHSSTHSQKSHAHLHALTTTFSCTLLLTSWSLVHCFAHFCAHSCRSHTWCTLSLMCTLAHFHTLTCSLLYTFGHTHCLLRILCLEHFHAHTLTLSCTLWIDGVYSWQAAFTIQCFAAHVRLQKLLHLFIYF